MTGTDVCRAAGHSHEVLQHIRCAVVHLTPELDVDAMNPEAERTYAACAANVLHRSFAFSGGSRTVVEGEEP